MEKVILNEADERLARMIGDCLTKSHQGARNAVLTSAIVKGMKMYADRANVRLNDVKIRKYVQWLRVNNVCVGLCSTTTGGYYVAETADELRECCERLRERMSNQYQTERALRRQLNAWLNQGQTEIELQ